MHIPTSVEQCIYLEEGQRQSLSITCCSGCSTTTTEVTDKIQNSTTVDNSWSFVNLHLPSTITTAVVILIMIITAWVLFRIYARFNKPRPQTTCSGQTSPSLPTLAPTPWPSSTSIPALTTTPLALDMETLMKAVAHRPNSTMQVPIQAKGPSPPAAHFP